MRIRAVLFCLVALAGCQREKRELRPAPTSTAVYGDAARQSELEPGGPSLDRRGGRPVVNNPYEGNAFAIAEGQRLFGWYNCSGCHANGGGGIGPPLIKQTWIYGSAPENLFDTIVKGRPNGMPAWGGRIPEYQIWQLVAYVRSLSQMEPRSATPVRADTIEKNPENVPHPSVGDAR